MLHSSFGCVHISDGVHVLRDGFDWCSGLSFRLVAAISSSCCSFIDSYIDLEAPLSVLTFFSPRFAERAAPAAICWAFDFAGMSYLILACEPLGFCNVFALPMRMEPLFIFALSNAMVRPVRLLFILFSDL
jgi:hypothetical protein